MALELQTDIRYLKGVGGKLGPPAGRKTRWGEEGAPQRGGLPVV